MASDVEIDNAIGHSFRAFRKMASAMGHGEFRSAAGLAVARALKRYDPAKGTLARYACLYVKSQASTTMRSDLLRVGRECQAPGGRDEMLWDAPARRVPCPSVSLDVREAVSRLSPIRRQIIEMMLDGHTQEEIAKARGVSAQAVSLGVKRAYGDLRESLAAYSNTGDS